MNRILIAAVAVLGMAGVASAQQAPQLSGNYSANVLNSYDNGARQGDANVDLSSYASITNAPAARQAQQAGTPTVFDTNYSR
jgi:hypothetical protein